jgi:hypothetical protein
MQKNLSALLKVTWNRPKPSWTQIAAGLKTFATTRRYEESDMVLEADDLSAAIKVAEDVLSWVKTHVG